MHCKIWKLFARTIHKTKEKKKLLSLGFQNMSLDWLCTGLRGCRVISYYTIYYSKRIQTTIRNGKHTGRVQKRPVWAPSALLMGSVVSACSFISVCGNTQGTTCLRCSSEIWYPGFLLRKWVIKSGASMAYHIREQVRNPVLQGPQADR